MKKLYYLSTCSTCRRIIREIEPGEEFIQQDLKTSPISPEQLDFVYRFTGNYQSVFNKQARKYRELSLHNEDLSEEKMRELILEEYTFLKRPIFILDDRIFVGNNRKVVAELSSFVQQQKKERVF
ncbi:arsenate reductase family protein [Labilibacter marinus]|uniref:arsenate reductase family protein n=1 Tax=Labilibacter marinus TaxID=1477105 RepID=UPI00094FA7AA|nr:ArsC/Spx/MgsR family protein [Labilibacter marinus]